jgi:hypothetical protein
MFFGAVNIPYKETGPASDVVVYASDIFSQKTQADELGADEDKENGKKGENTIRGPGGTIQQAQNR